MTARSFAPVAIAMTLATTGCAGTAARPASASAAIAGIEARLDRLRTIRAMVLPLLPAARAARIERAITGVEHLLVVARTAADAMVRADAIHCADRAVDEIETASEQ